MDPESLSPDPGCPDCNHQAVHEEISRLNAQVEVLELANRTYVGLFGAMAAEHREVAKLRQMLVAVQAMMERLLHGEDLVEVVSETTRTLRGMEGESD